LGRRRQWFGQQKPPPTARDHDPEQVMVWPRSGVRDQPVAVRPDGLEVDVEAQVLGRTLKPGQVTLERERAPVVDADDLEHAVTTDQPLVGGGDRRLRDRHDVAVQRSERADALSAHLAEITSPTCVQTSARRMIVAAAEAMSLTDAHSRTE